MEQENDFGKLVNNFVLLLITSAVWYILFWYFLLPEWPYTFKAPSGEWLCKLDIFPYTSSTTLAELPAFLQRAYIVGFIALFVSAKILNWVCDKIVNLFL